MSASLDSGYQPTDLRDTAADKQRDFESLQPPTPEQITVAGVPCVVNRVRLRELMLLARVVTRGVGENMTMVNWDSPDVDQQLQGLLIVAIPESGEEMLDLIRVLIQPAEKITDDEVRKAFAAEMANPDVPVTLDALTVMLRQEKDTIPMLVGKFRVLLKAAMVLWRREQAQEQHNAAQRPPAGAR